jgi:Protein of unknown function (DUF2442)
MNPRIIEVQALENYILKLKFTDKSTRVFDMKPYLVYPVFQELTADNLFIKAKVNLGTVMLNEVLDMSPDTLFLESKLFVE